MSLLAGTTVVAGRGWARGALGWALEMDQNCKTLHAYRTGDICKFGVLVP